MSKPVKNMAISKIPTKGRSLDSQIKAPSMKVYLAAPRGFCAGVDRAIQIVELALKKDGTRITENLDFAVASRH